MSKLIEELEQGRDRNGQELYTVGVQADGRWVLTTPTKTIRGKADKIITERNKLWKEQRK